MNNVLIHTLRKHYFIFSKFYHGFLLRHKWDEKSQLTQQMLKEHFDCKDERWTISKKKITVMSIKSFEKIDNDSTTIQIILSPFKLLIILIIFLLPL